MLSDNQNFAVAGLRDDTALDAQQRERERSYLSSIAARLATAWDGAMTTLLDGPVVGALVNFAATSGSDLVVMTTHGRGALSRAWLGSVADQLIRQQLLIGSPAMTVLDYARTHAVDLIALETHGRSGVARFFLGSTADKIVRGADVPVLLHRP